MYNLGRILWGRGRYPEAEKLDRETLDIRRRVLGPEHPDTLASISNLAADLRNEHHHPEAQKLFRETFDSRRRCNTRAETARAPPRFLGSAAKAYEPNSSASRFLRISILFE
jgi:Tetratricopeptide repeat